METGHGFLVTGYPKRQECASHYRMKRNGNGPAVPEATPTTGLGARAKDFSPYANMGDIRLKESAACTSYKFYESVRIIENPNKYDDWIPRDTTYNDGGFISEPVGRYIRSPWDLSDMHGNVWNYSFYLQALSLSSR